MVSKPTGHLPAGSRRWPLLALASAALLLMIFYAVIDGAHVDHDPLLTAGDWAGYALCHRITDRSFTIDGRQFPLCARCTGMYLGAGLTAVALFLAGRKRRVLLPQKAIFLALLGLIAIMGVDGLNSYSHFFPSAPHLYEPRNALRLATGMGAGLTLGIITFAALAQALWRPPVYRPLLENWREFGALLALGSTGVLAVLSNQAALLYVLAVASSAGLLFVVTALNSALLLVALRSDGQSTTWKEAARPLLAGFLLAILELSAVSALRWSVTGTMAGFPGL
ncbi:MAG: DUF2085 domain-containing protein [Candidatus Promineifilaceae bacterium]